MSKILVTGSAGFIGMHTAIKLVNDGHEVVGIDNLNDYYDVNLKLGRLKEQGIDVSGITENQLLHGKDKLGFAKIDLKNKESLFQLFEENHFDLVVHLAAQAGVRYSIDNPDVYINSNIRGFFNVLEACRHFPVKHLVYASSSSVYGLNGKIPFSTADNVDHPISLYAATKKSNELMAHSYSYLFNIPTTGLRFFTVYGPWGRPDMALFKFTKAIINEQAIDVYNHGNMKRDFTYIDDIVEGIVKVVFQPALPDKDWTGVQQNPSASPAPYRVYNIGKGNPSGLMEFISTLESAIGKNAEINFLPLQAGDMEVTYADTSALERDFGFTPKMELEQGVKKFVEWYKSYYK